MTHSSPTALRLALRLADPETADALAERLRPELMAALTERLGLSQESLAGLLGPDAAALRAAMAEEPEAFLLRAAAAGDPEVARALWSAQYLPSGQHRKRPVKDIPGLLDALMAGAGAADPTDPRWDEEGGLVPVFQEEATPVEVVAALTGPFPQLISYALGRLAPNLPLMAALDACTALAHLAGGEVFRAFVRAVEGATDLDLGHPELLDLLRSAAGADDPAAFLREHRPAGAPTDPAMVRALLRARDGFGHQERPEAVDWDLVRQEHARYPFGTEPRPARGFRPGNPLFTLIRWEGCPRELVLEAFRTDPSATARSAAELPFETLVGPEARAGRVPLEEVLGRGIRAGWLSAERVLTEVTPAMEVLHALPYDHEPTRKAIGALLAPLGTDPVNWLTCYARLGRARGTVAELIADAADATSRQKRTTAWPRRLEAVFPATAPEASRAAFLGLFGCASQEAQTAVVPHFDPRAVQHLLVYGDPSPAVRDALTAAHGVAAPASQAACRSLSPEQLQHLLDLDAPQVDAVLFLHGHIDQRERERMLAGRLRGGGTRRVPDALLRTLDEVNLGHYRHWLVAGLESGDLGVARKIVGRLKLQTPAARLRLLIAVWERNGPDGVREILAMDRLPVALRRQTERALEAPDGLEQLRARLAAEEDPAKLIAYLTTAPSYAADRQAHKLAGDGIALPWPALIEARRAGELPGRLATALAERPDCPRELLLELLPDAPASGHDDRTWVRSALRRGALTPEDLLDHCGPAREALGRLLRAVESPDAQADRRGIRHRAAALATAHLGTDVEAWALCLQLLPTFAGSLRELMTTAGALMHPAV
ncbi:hypothetical protein [Streptomyces sp. NPDC020742]|uniref:hypothetical protein n=1 Tax=Streptomyces sp. NPDC020742 TaxID=3154897 RepID=UPI0033E10B78